MERNCGVEWIIICMETKLHGVDFNDVIEFTLDHVLAVHPVHREALVLSMSPEDIKNLRFG